jgi:hypothetical protein
MNKLNPGRVSLPCLFVILFLSFSFDGYSQTENKVEERKKKKEARLKRQLEKINRNEGKTTNTYVVVYDFAKKTYDTNFVRPRINHPVVLKVVNINRFAYDVKISSRDSVLAVSDVDGDTGAKKVEGETSKPGDETSIPPIQKPSGGDIDETDSKKKAALLEDLNSMAKLTQLEANKKILEERVKSNTELLSNLKLDETKLAQKDNQITTTLSGSVADTISSKLKLEQARLKSELATVRGAVKSAEDAITKDKAELTAQEIQIKNITIQDESVKNYGKKLVSLEETFANLVKGYRNVWEIFKKNNQLLSISTQPLLSPDDFISACKDSSLLLNDPIIFQYRNYVSEFYGRLGDFYQQYDQVINDYEIIRILSNEGVKKMQANSRALKVSADNMKETIKERKPNDVINNMVHAFKTMSKQNAYELVSAPIQPSQDLVVFDVAIAHKTVKEYRDDRSFSYREYVRGGLRYDFSTGLVIGFGVNGKSYQAVGSSSPDSIRISANQKTNKYLPTIAAMLHASIRSWRQLSVGFTLGASISTSELDIESLFPGISLMLGKSEKIIFTVGPALKKIDYLDSRYLLNSNYAKTGFPADVPVKATFRVGWFVGVSYNLTKSQKSNFKLAKDK